MTRILVVGWPIVISVAVVAGHHMWVKRQQRIELERLERARELQRERYAAHRMALEIRNNRRRATAEQAEQVHDKVQQWLTDALRVREAGLVEQFRKELDEL